MRPLRHLEAAASLAHWRSYARSFQKGKECSLVLSESSICRNMNCFMCDDLDYILDNEKGWRYRYSQALLLSANRTTWGWALLQPVARRPRYSAQFFVDPTQRGKGYGKALLQAAQQGLKGRVPLCYLDDENEGFFSKYPTLFERYEEDEDIPA
jgi:GNAT superfamily N-acetyltransferase